MRALAALLLLCLAQSWGAQPPGNRGGGGYGGGESSQGGYQGGTSAGGGSGGGGYSGGGSGGGGSSGGGSGAPSYSMGVSGGGISYGSQGAGVAGAGGNYQGIGSPPPAQSAPESPGFFRSSRYVPADPNAPQPIAAEPAEAQPEENAAPMALADAKMNFETVVQNFAAKCGSAYCRLADSRTKRAWTARLSAVDQASISEVRPGFFRGRARFEDQTGKPIETLVTVDLSGAQWRVSEVSVKKAGKAAPAKKKRK